MTGLTGQLVHPVNVIVERRQGSWLKNEGVAWDRVTV